MPSPDLNLTPEQIAQGEADIRANHQEALERIYREQREGAWKRVTPAEYREPWDWAKADPRCNRAEIERVWNWQRGPRGLYIIGRTGLCKTRALHVLLRRLIVEEKRNVKLITGVQFAAEAAAAFGDPSTTKRWLREFTEVPTLAIDDVAKRWTPATEDAFFEIVDARTSNQKPLLLTSNYTADHLRTMSKARGEAAVARDMIEPILRRLRDYCDIVCVEEGADE